MSTREALLHDLAKQPESILRKVRQYLDNLVRPNAESNGVSRADSRSWPEGYFDETAGALSGERFERPSQPVFEKRGQW